MRLIGQIFGHCDRCRTLDSVHALSPVWLPGIGIGQKAKYRSPTDWFLCVDCLVQTASELAGILEKL